MTAPYLMIDIRAKFENTDFAPFCVVGNEGHPSRINLLTPMQHK